MEIEEIIKILETRNVFITGGGGVGKSYTISLLNKELPLTLTSSTGISAINIGGQTIHSWLGIGTCEKDKEDAVAKLYSRKNRAKLKEIQAAEYLVIDEVSMINSYTFDYINFVLKQVRQVDEAFGGLRVILTGDFFQLPPVFIGKIKEINNKNVFIDYCFNSEAWKELNLKIINLTKVYRQTDKNFIDSLNRIRVGKCSEKDEKMIQSRITYAEPPKDCVKLFGTNKMVDDENTRKYNQLKGEERIYKAVDKIRIYSSDGDSKMVNPHTHELKDEDADLWYDFNKNCRVPEILKLKVDTRVMLLRNRDFEEGLVNGSCGTVAELSERSFLVKFDNGIDCWIGEEDIEITKQGETKILRTQIPLNLCYSSSIHKSQGLTFDNIWIDFKNIFAAGQAYVALSRVKSLSGLYIKGFNKNKVFADNKVKEFYEGLK